MNGLDPAQPLLAGTALKLPTGGRRPRRGGAGHAGAAAVVADAAPNPTPGEVTAPQIGEVASSHGVSPSLAAAVAWQESGFQNGVVSSANARGVMQILPGHVGLDRAAARRTRSSTRTRRSTTCSRGDVPAPAARATPAATRRRPLASYYQGAASVRRIGLLPETQRYVANVMALRPRFGG